MLDWLASYSYETALLATYALLALSVFVVFQCGLVSLASVGFMAIGAYTSALLSVRLGLPVLLTTIAGTCLAAALGFVSGLLIMRLRGIYVALGSLALAQAAVSAIANLRFTNGVLGIQKIPVTTTPLEALIILAAAAAVIQVVLRSRAGRALRAIQLDERTAVGFGVDSLAFKTAAFTASGALAGLAGALEAHLTGFVSPEQYDFTLLVQVLTYAILGGTTYWLGPVVAVLAIAVLRDSLSLTDALVEDATYGLLLLLVVLLSPKGLPDGALRARAWLSSRIRRRSGRRRIGTEPPDQSPSIDARARPSWLSRGGSLESKLEVSGVSKRFGGLFAVRDVGLTVPANSVFGIIGPNGAGKTTLINVITRYERADHGSIRFRERELTKLRPSSLADLGIARTYQNLRLFDEWSVFDNVMLGAYATYTSPVWQFELRGDDERRVRELVQGLIEWLGLEAVAAQPAGKLPYGLRRRVEIARALAASPVLVFLDEPVAGMTRAEADAIGMVIREMKEAGVTVVLIEHNVRLVSAVCDQIAVLDHGQTIATGTPTEVWKHPKVQEAYLGKVAEPAPQEVGALDA